MEFFVRCRRTYIFNELNILYQDKFDKSGESLEVKMETIEMLERYFNAGNLPIYNI